MKLKFCLDKNLSVPFDFNRTKRVISTYQLQDSCLRAGLLTRVYTENQMFVMPDQDLIILRGHYQRLLLALNKEV